MGYRGFKFLPDNVPLSNKSKVYFCSTSRDFELYFKQIRDEILYFQPNVVFCCLEDMDSDIEGEDKESFLSDLEEVKLFVIPLTSDFLLLNHRARLLDFEFAIEKHIPVLLLSMEENLKESIPDINERIHRLQYLNKNKVDVTAIPYKKKLESFLSSVLIGDEQTKKVQSAFATYIFLSYRKKDRAYAKKIMHDIHKYFLFRDIAIWYDEFIVPGRNFRTDIDDAMNKSDLLVLTVTPNVLEEGNFVREVEYKMAVDKSKEILPIESVSTDKEELAFAFPGLSTCVEDEDALIFRLQNFIERHKNIKDKLMNADTPEHQYLIGLAYLAGIDVEVDGNKAMELFQKAVEGGYGPAYERIVAMYRDGNGVERDHKATVEWQKKYVDFLVSLYEQSKEEVEQTLLNELMNLVFFLDDINDFEEERLYCDKIIELNLIDPETYEYSSILSLYGSSFAVEGNLKEARECYEKAMEILKRFPSENDNEYLDDIATLMSYIGEISRDEGDFENAKLYFEKSLDIRTELANRENSEMGVERVISSYIHLAQLEVDSKNHRGAKAYYEKARSLADGLLEKKPSFRVKRTMANIIGNMGDIASSEGDLKSAQDCYEYALGINEDIEREIQSIDAKRNLAISFARLGEIKKCEYDLDAAKYYFEKALEICENIGEIALEVHSILMCELLRYLCLIESEEGNLNAAEKDMLKALSISENLINRNKTLNASECYMKTIATLGDVYKDEENLVEAKKCFEKAYDIASELYSQFDLYSVSRRFAMIASGLGDIAYFEKNFEIAKKYYVEACDVFEDLIKKTGSIEAQRMRAIILFCLGDLSLKENNFVDARKWYEQSLSIRKNIANESDSIEILDELQLILGQLGYVCMLESDWLSAKKYFEEAKEIVVYLPDSDKYIELIDGYLRSIADKT